MDTLQNRSKYKYSNADIIIYKHTPTSETMGSDFEGCMCIYVHGIHLIAVKLDM